MKKKSRFLKPAKLTRCAVFPTSKDPLQAIRIARSNDLSIFGFPRNAALFV